MLDDPLLPQVGVAPIDAHSARWCVWAPNAKNVALILGAGPAAARCPMDALPRGYHACTTPMPAAGDRYAFSLDGGPPLADPLSRCQPDGINAPSAVCLPGRFVWNEGTWRGVAQADLVFYELHVGTFSSEGTFDAILPRVADLLDLGITAIELMPIAQFPGTRSWGYDGVLPFAVQNSYGGPESLQRLVAACHRAGMAVFLDVVYNHFGPEGNIFPYFGEYLTDRFKTDWGCAVNYDGRGGDSVRAMVLENARMWIRDYRVDGLRLDAADQIFDRGPRHILSEITEVVHAEAAKLGRPCHVFAETDMNDAPRFLNPLERGGHGLDGHWNDDFHHAAHVVLTGETDGYYADFADGPAALAKAYERVFVNDGTYSAFRGRRHGAPATEFSGHRFVAFTQNHDQVGNRLRSDRLASTLAPRSSGSPRVSCSSRLVCLFSSWVRSMARRIHFPFFCDFQTEELIEAVRTGRKAEFSHFKWEDDPPDPVSPATRDSAILSWSWSSPQRAGLRRLYRDLLRLRRESPALRDPNHARTRLSADGKILEVDRGANSSEAAPHLRIYFNFSDHSHILEAKAGSELFRSEIAAYGASELDAARRVNELRPHEFQIFSPIDGSKPQMPNPIETDL